MDWKQDEVPSKNSPGNSGALFKLGGEKVHLFAVKSGKMKAALRHNIREREG